MGSQRDFLSRTKSRSNSWGSHKSNFITSAISLVLPMGTAPSLPPYVLLLPLHPAKSRTNFEIKRKASREKASGSRCSNGVQIVRNKIKIVENVSTYRKKLFISRSQRIPPPIKETSAESQFARFPFLGGLGVLWGSLSATGFVFPRQFQAKLSKEGISSWTAIASGKAMMATYTIGILY